MDVWLRREHGVGYVELPFAGKFKAMMALTEAYLPDLHVTFLGTSKLGVNHVVIVRNGEIVHDPSPRKTGIVGPASDGHYWLGLLVEVV